MPDNSPLPLSRRHVLAGLGVTLFWPSTSARAAAVPVVLRAGPGRLPFAPEAAALHYNGSIPGPLLRARQGEELVVRLENGLDRPTSLHWHGVRLPNAMDGAAGLTQDAVAPGAAFEYRFPLADAGTYLYRPGVPGDGAGQLDAGLSGVLIVEEAAPPRFDRELVMVIDDWPAGGGGVQLTVNSKEEERVSLAPHERLRLRIVNAASARVAAVAVAGATAWLVAVDGQPANTPFQPEDGRLDLAPGGRADIFIDGGAEPGRQAGVAIENAGRIQQLLFIEQAVGAARRQQPLPRPDTLASNSLPPDFALQKARRFDTTLGDAIPAKGWAARAVPPKPLFSVKRGSLVTLGLGNKGAAASAVHLHGQVMRILHPLDDGWQPYWVNGVVVKPDETVYVAFIAETPGKWLIESRALGGEALERNAWFQTT